MQGLLLVDKPAGWTSFDVVNKIRRIVATAEGKKPKNVKVGHTGTLDPFATGLLIILIGKEYTKKAADYSKLDKTYEVTMRLGEISSTGDPEGEIMPASGPEPSTEELQAAVDQFKGDVQQVPPTYSAIKVDGQRAYKLARAGHEVVMEARQVTINKLEITSYDYPEVKLVADVSSGTYIRTLIEDIAKACGTGAYATALRRLKVANFSVKEAVRMDGLTQERIIELLKHS